MNRPLTTLLILLLAGCINIADTTNCYTEGSALQLGLYIPYNGSTYGVQCVNFLSGRMIKTATTNHLPKVESAQAISNSIITATDSFKTS